MIFRPLNLIGFLAAATAGLHLYQTKHEVALMDRELRGIAKQIDETQDRTQALNAEWAWLNEPERLKGVAQRHLALEPMQPGQFVRLQDAERRLPSIAAYAGTTAFFAERETRMPQGPVRLALLQRPEVAPVRVAKATPAPAASPNSISVPVGVDQFAAPAETLPVVRPSAPPPAPSMPASAPITNTAPATAVPAVPVPLAAQRPTPRPAEPRLEVIRAAPPKPIITVAATHRPAAPPARPLPVVASVRPAASAITQVAAAPSPRLVDPPITSIGSVLGGRGSLPPPVPFGSANAATLGTQ